MGKIQVAVATSESCTDKKSLMGNCHVAERVIYKHFCNCQIRNCHEAGSKWT
jgi:hypothetical protein